MTNIHVPCGFLRVGWRKRPLLVLRHWNDSSLEKGSFVLGCWGYLQVCFRGLVADEPGSSRWGAYKHSQAANRVIDPLQTSCCALEESLSFRAAGLSFTSLPNKKAWSQQRAVGHESLPVHVPKYMYVD